MTRRTTLATGAAAAAFAGSAHAQPKRATIYGHRGASALRPEHTLGSYAKAIADGVDVIEPDLVSTKDGVLIARHEPNIDETTDIEAHPEFASRKRTLPFDGRMVTGFFTIDFTLDELKTLRCKERLGAKVRPESASYDGQFQIVTWEEMIDFAAAESAARGRLIGLVPELKSSTWHAANGHPINERFLEVTARHEFTRRAPLHIQSFEIDNLKFLRAKMGRPANVKLVQLVGSPRERPVDVPSLTYGAMTTLEGLRTIKTYADVVAPQLRGVIPLDAAGNIGAANSLVPDAHAAGLGVVVWTFRPENQFLPKDLRSAAGPDARNEAGSLAEMKRFLELGVDGFFTDDPAIGRRAVEAFAQRA
ncbi:glycerophosphodiester phosphodiesterase [soil metagenome]